MLSTGSKLLQLQLVASRAPAQLVAALRHLGSSWTREPVSPSLAGGFFTTGPLGKALHSFFFFFSSHIRTQTQKAETPNQLVYFFLIKMKESSNQEIPTPAFFLELLFLGCLHRQLPPSFKLLLPCHLPLRSPCSPDLKPQPATLTSLHLPALLFSQAHDTC